MYKDKYNVKYSTESNCRKWYIVSLHYMLCNDTSVDGIVDKILWAFSFRATMNYWILTLLITNIEYRKNMTCSLNMSKETIVTLHKWGTHARHWMEKLKCESFYIHHWIRDHTVVQEVLCEGGGGSCTLKVMRESKSAKACAYAI